MVLRLLQQVQTPTFTETGEKIGRLFNSKNINRTIIEEIESSFTGSKDPNARWQYHQFYKALTWVADQPHKARIHAADLAKHARCHVFFEETDKESSKSSSWYERYSQSNKPYILGLAGALLGSAIFVTGIAVTAAVNPVIGISVALVGALVTVLTLLLAVATKKGPDYSKETAGYTAVFESVARALDPTVKFEEPKGESSFSAVSQFGGFRLA